MKMTKTDRMKEKEDEKLGVKEKEGRRINNDR